MSFMSAFLKNMSIFMLFVSFMSLVGCLHKVYMEIIACVSIVGDNSKTSQYK